MGIQMRDASFSLATAKWAAHPNDFGYSRLDFTNNFFLRSVVLENVGSASYKLKLSTDNVAGVHLPNFEQYDDNSKLRKNNFADSHLSQLKNSQDWQKEENKFKIAAQLILPLWKD